MKRFFQPRYLLPLLISASLALPLALPTTPTPANAQAAAPTVTLNHDTDVFGVQWSPDGARILTWTAFSITIWDAQSGADVLRINGPLDAQGFALVEWRPEANRILTSTINNEITVYDSTTAAVVAAIADETFLDWSANGERILTQGEGFSNVRTIGGATVTVERTALVARISPDGRFAVLDNQLWDIAANTVLALPVAPVVSADWTPDAQTVLLGAADGTAQTLALPSADNAAPTPLVTFGTPLDVQGLAYQFVAEGNLVAAQLGAARLDIFDSSGTLLQTTTAPGPIIGVDWAGTRVALTALTDTQNVLTVIDAFAGQLAQYNYGTDFLSASWEPNGAYLMARFFTNSIVLFNPMTGAGLYELQFDTLPGIIWHPSAFVFAARVGAAVEIYDLTPFAVEFE